MSTSTLPEPLPQEQPVEPEPAPTDPVAEETTGFARFSILGQRRQFVVDRRSQYRAAALVAAAVLLLLVLLNVALYLTRAQATATILSHTPALETMLRDHDRTEFTLVLTGSVIFLLTVFAITILETHKTAGAAYKLSLGMAALRDSNYGVCTVLRRGDNLRNLEEELNRLSETLFERSGHHAAELDELAEGARQISTPPEAQALAARLAELANRERARLV